MTSRGVARRSALEPENPVRYRTLARLVTSSPSTCAAVSPSASAARRRGRGSDTWPREASGKTTQCELVPVRTEAAHDRRRRGGEHGVAALRLAGVDVRQVYLDEGNFHGGERVADREAGMAVGAGVDQRAVSVPS